MKIAVTETKLIKYIEQLSELTDKPYEDMTQDDIDKYCELKTRVGNALAIRAVSKCLAAAKSE